MLITIQKQIQTKNCKYKLGAVHKLRLQEKGGGVGGGGPNNWLFVKFHTIENVNGGR